MSPDRYKSIRRYLCALLRASGHTHADAAAADADTNLERDNVNNTNKIELYEI